MSRALELQLLLRVNDQMSVQLQNALRNAQREADRARRELNRLGGGLNDLNPAPINRITNALRLMGDAGRASLSTMGKLSQAGMAAFAGGYVAKRMLDKPMSYDRQLALKANTAYQDRDVLGRIAGKTELDQAIRVAVKANGGTPELALEGLNALIGSGAMGDGKDGIKNSLKVLPALLRANTGTGADIGALAQILTASKQSMGLTDQQLPSVLSKAIRAGQMGGFELPDMAKWLPQQMALAASNGMHGMDAIEALLAANQVSRITAGTADMAGNNMVNLLAKINSQDTRHDFEKISKVTGRKLTAKEAKEGKGIDLTDKLMVLRAQGINPLEGFIKMVNEIASKDKNYKKLQAKAESLPEGERRETIMEMADLLIGKSIGLAVQDRQALGGLLAMIQQPEKYKTIKQGVANERGSELNASHDVVAATADAKAEQVSNRAAFAAMDALKAIEQPLGNMLDGVNDVADASPTLARNLYMAASAAAVFAASAGAASLFSGGSGAGLGLGLGGLLGGAGGARLLNLARGTGVLAAGLPLSQLLAAGGVGAGALTVGGVALAGAGGYGVMRGANALTGGSIDRVGSMLLNPVFDKIFAKEQKPVKVTVDVKNGNIVASVNEANARQASRH